MKMECEKLTFKDCTKYRCLGSDALTLCLLVADGVCGRGQEKYVNE